MQCAAWISSIAMLGLITATTVSAETHGAEERVSMSSDEATLIAIKEALVSEAQSVESQVINTAWLDAEGRLHESTMVQSGMRVRGIQVQAYLDEMQKPKVEIALDEKTGLLPQCFVKDDHLKRTVRVLPIELAESFSVDTVHLAVDSANRLSAQFADFFERTSHWQRKPVGQEVDQYTQMTTGLAPETSKFELQVAVAGGFPPETHQPEAIPGADSISAFFNGSPAKFAEDWIRLTAVLRESTTQDVIWTGVADFRIPVRDVSYQAGSLPRTLVAVIDEQTAVWTQELTEYALCEPVRFEIMAAETAIQVNGGADAGLRTGDRLLLIDETRIPSRVLEPGALAELSLVEVITVESDRATVEYRAGAPIATAAGKVAIPF